MSKKILVTGSNGLLGQKILRKLIANPNFELIATSQGKNRVSLTEGYIYESMDITSEEEINTIFGKYQPDVVINTAAMTNVDACEDNQEGCWDINVNAVEKLLNASQIHSSHLIHLSTDFVFDGEDGPYKETDEPNPLSYYAKSKLASEKLLLQSKYKNTAIARTIIVYGIGENLSRGNIVVWAKGAMEKQQPLTIIDDQFRSPTLAEDLADGCILIAEKKATGIYHLSGKDSMSILELVYRVADYYGLDKSCVTPIKTATLNQKAKRPPKTGFILDKAIKDLGYSPHSFEEGLAIITEQLKS
jgi:dTDP-4-dehydrorhamnose reductase